MKTMKSRNVPKLGLLASLGLLARLGAAAAESAAPEGVVHIGIQRRSAVDGRPLLRRAGGTITERLDNDIRQGAYMADVKVGTPPQTLTLQLDTGSSDAWMVYTGSAICKKGECSDGSFDPNESSTYATLLKDDFSIAYADKTSAKGDYFNDAFTIGGSTLKNLTMGIGIDTDIPYGLLGVGYPANEAGVRAGKIQPYSNLPVQMVEEGFTNTVAFSMWLNDLESSSGSILFSGIDTTKYTPPLTRLTLYPTKDSSTIHEFAVALTSLTAVSKSGTDRLGSTSFPLAAILDAGSTSSYLPADLVSQIYAEAGVTLDDKGSPALPCDYRAAAGYLAFGFGGPGGAVVNVGLSELVLGAVGNYTGGKHDGKTACRFGIRTAQEGGSFVLGDTFLRSAYVVYDLINDQAALAQAKFNVTETNVVPFASLSATIPSSTPAPNEAKVEEGLVTATPTSYAAAAAFTATSGAAAGRLGGERGLLGGVALAVMVSVGAGFVGFLV